MLTTTNNRLIGIGALLLTLIFLAWVLWGLWLRGDELVKQRNSRVGGTDTTMAAVDTGPVRYNVGQIISSHLFGTKIVKAAPKVVQTVAPPTNLRLRLVGILATSGQDDQVARALIALESGIAKSYAVGDAIDRTDSTLHAVESSRVLLDRNGRIEALELQRKVLPPEGAGPRNRGQQQRQNLG